MSEQILNDVLSSLKVISIPTRTKFRGITLREIALFEGPFGWAEFSPFLEYDENESLPWLMSGIEAAFAPALPVNRTEIPINATMPEVDDRVEIEKILSWYPGATTVKIKVGTDLTRDLARIAWVKALSPHSQIRVDVNGSWSAEHALMAINSIYEIIGDAFQYIEQPCATIEELRSVKGELKVPVNKSTMAIKEMLLASLDNVGGQAYFQQQAIENPNAYMALIGKIIPAEVKKEITGADGGPVQHAIKVKFGD